MYRPQPERNRNTAEAYRDPRDRPSVLVTSPGSPDLLSDDFAHANSSGPSIGSRYAHRLLPGAPGVPIDPNVGGRIQIKLGYDPNAQQLLITVIGASGLRMRSNGTERNPYIKLYLLPDRTENSKRRTRTMGTTNEPRWGQVFRYSGYRRIDLSKRLIEVSYLNKRPGYWVLTNVFWVFLLYVQITAWDYSRYGNNEFLGMTLLDIAGHALDDEAEWYPLRSQHDAHQSLKVRCFFFQLMIIV